MQVISRAKQHPGLAAVIVIVVLAGVGFGIFWFGPQFLLLNETANDALPSAHDDAAAADVMTVSEGSFVSLAHGTTGTARIVEVSGTPYLRLEDLDSLNGPDLFVYLTSQAATDNASAFDDTVVVDLGPLAANRGDLTIEIPADTDLAEVRSVVIWCRRFTVAFGAADLATVS